MEVVCRFPGGLDFGRGLVDVNVRLPPPLPSRITRDYFSYVVHNVAAFPLSES